MSARVTRVTTMIGSESTKLVLCFWPWRWCLGFTFGPAVNAGAFDCFAALPGGCGPTASLLALLTRLRELSVRHTWTLRCAQLEVRSVSSEWGSAAVVVNTAVGVIFAVSTALVHDLMQS